MSLNVYFVSETNELSEPQSKHLAACLDYQLKYHFGRSGWRSDCYCTYVPKVSEAKIAPGGAILHVLDTSDQQGALGYHDEDGNGVPYAKVFAQSAKEDGDTISEVASHEILELVCDPHVNDSCVDSNRNFLWAKEVGDPCQGNGYDLGALSGVKTGVIVADFVLPNFFDPNTHSDSVTDFRGALKGPFSLAPQGYYSYVDLNNTPKGWQNAFGHERSELPKWASRIQRRV